MTARVEFVVPGEPVPQGSMKAVPGRGRAEGRTFLVADNEAVLKHYRRDVAVAATAVLAALNRLPGGAWSTDAFPGPAHSTRIPVAVTARFVCTRPGPGRSGHHFDFPITGDLDKFERALLDGMTGVVYKDDAQVVELHAVKRLVREGEPPHTQVLVRLADEEGT